MNKEELLKEIEKLNIKISEEQQNKLEEYANFLLEYNEHTNLTAIKQKNEVYLKHFYDSLTLTKIINLKNQKLLDVGTGAGFPGLVLGIIFPELQVTLLDSNNKKTAFLKECVKKWNLKNIEVIHERAEEYVRKNREVFDIVTSRAVAELRILVELNIPCLKVDGYFIAMKGNIKDEEINAKQTINKLNSEVIEKQEFELPFDGGHRTLIKIKKKDITNPIYPRNYDKIKKRAI